MIIYSLILYHNTIRNTVDCIVILLNYNIFHFRRLYYIIVRYAKQYIRLSTYYIKVQSTL